MENLFVYGTLAPGHPNAHILKNIGGTWQPGSIKGHLYNEGWGADMGFPAIVLDVDGESVAGFLFSSEKIEEHWNKLDEFEGSAYNRVLTNVELADGKTISAFVYALKRNINL